MEPSHTSNHFDTTNQLDFEADDVPLTNTTNISTHVSPATRELAADQIVDNLSISISSEWQPLIDLVQPTNSNGGSPSNAEKDADQRKKKMIQIIGDLIKSNEAAFLDHDALNQLFELIGYPLDNDNKHLNDVYSNGINVIQLMRHITALKHEKEKPLQNNDNQNVEHQLSTDLMSNEPEIPQPIGEKVVETSVHDLTENNETEPKEDLNSKSCSYRFPIFDAVPNASIFDPLPEANLDTPIVNELSQYSPVEVLAPPFSPVAIGNSEIAKLAEKSVTSDNTSGRQEALPPMKRAPLRRKNANSKINFKTKCKENIIQNKYILLDKIGSGTYGKVYKGQNYFTNEIVAIKRIHTDCKPDTLESHKKFMARERDHLRELVDCSTIVRLIDAYDVDVDGKLIKMDLIFEYCEYDLAKVLKSCASIRIDEVKCFLRQILTGLYYMHENLIFHRDLKTDNILLTSGGVVKIGDFGLSRKMQSDKELRRNYSNHVVTLWYRAPELLFGERNYTDRIDLWSLGCIMAEFWTRDPVMRGKSEIDQLKYISQLGGSFDPKDWPSIVNLRLYNTFELPGPYKRRTLTYLQHGMLNEEANYFFDKLLMYDPDKRHSAWTALNDAFFFSDPIPSRDLTGFMRRNKTSLPPQVHDSTENQEN